MRLVQKAESDPPNQSQCSGSSVLSTSQAHKKSKAVFRQEKVYVSEEKPVQEPVRYHFLGVIQNCFQKVGSFDLETMFSQHLDETENSQAVASKFRPFFGSEKVRVVYSSVTVKRKNVVNAFPVPDGTDFRCVTVGSILKSEGQEDAVLATAELRRLGLQPVLWIVGSTVDLEYERHLRLMVRDLPCQHGKGGCSCPLANAHYTNMLCNVPLMARIMKQSFL